MMPQAVALITLVVSRETGQMDPDLAIHEINTVIAELDDREIHDIIVTLAALMGGTLAKLSELKGEPVEEALHRFGVIVNASND